MKEFVLIVAGSRTITDWPFVENQINIFLDESFTDEYNTLTIVSGCAKGVDKLGEMYARCYDDGLQYCPADWDKFGKRAGFIRNHKMAQIASHCLVICENGSNGSLHMAETARTAGLITKFVEYERK
jgi:hypothetical protein